MVAQLQACISITCFDKLNNFSLGNINNMPNKRKKKNQTLKIYCPYCDQRLWRMGTGKHNLYFQGVTEIQQQFGLTRKKASLLVGQNSVQVDQSSWLEEFFCNFHGKMWIHLLKQTDGNILINIANEHHWKRSSNTIDPNLPNPSVSEFTYKMSYKSNRI